MAHVIVTEGLVDEAFVAERCDAESFRTGANGSRGRRTRPRRCGRDRRAGGRAARRGAALRDGQIGAIYYGLGVTEHAQGSTMVMGIANLAMATGNIGRAGVGVNPLRGQNNVQGACDMGSFPHELPGYRHISDATVRASFDAAWGVTLEPEPGLRIPNMFDAALDGSFKGLYCQGEDFVQSDPNTQHVTAAMSAMECVVVQDIFLNETAKYAHVFLPGSSFLEKDGTFTNAERRISRVRKVMPPLAGKADWEVTRALERARLPDGLRASVADHGRDRRADADLPRRQLREARSPGQRAVAVQRGHRRSRHRHHARRRLRARQGPLPDHPVRRDGREGHAPLPAAADDGPRPLPVQRRRPDPPDREQPGTAKTCSRSIPTTPTSGASADDWVCIESRAGDAVLRATVTERVQPGVVYTTFHFPSRAPTSSRPSPPTGRPTVPSTR